jgi:NAD-dependent SIR2 family protein deacetylase
VNGSYRKGHQPVKHQEFMGSELTRKRYWARSVPGWRTFHDAQPNAGHFALAELEARGLVHSVITQNVDRLHQKAGSKDVTDLHGRGDMCRCMSCGYTMPRKVMQETIEELNADWLERVRLPSSDDIRPDGDADIGNLDFSGFCVPGCPICGGVLKADVVFFGDNVPRERAEEANAKVASADKLLVVGSSLMVFSAFRLVASVAKRGGEIAIVNIGETRAQRDQLPVAVHIQRNSSEVLQSILEM